MSAFFIRRPIVAIVISLVLVIAGVVMMRGLPVAQYPNITPPAVKVSGLYTGADAVTVEQSVATPIEAQMNGVDKMLYMQSTNGSDGSFLLTVYFEVGTEPNLDSVLAQNRVSQAQARLPQSVQQYGLTVQKQFALPMLAFVVYSPHGTYDPGYLANYATINLNDRLARLPGIGNVSVVGSSSYAMRVWINPDTLAQLGLTVADVANAVRRQSSVNPAGQIGGEPAPKGQEFTYTIRAKGALVTPDEFADVIVRENPNGSVVRLKDVARIALGTETFTQIGKYNGKNSAVITVYQLPGSNALDAATAARHVMTESRAQFPPDMEYDVAFDSTLAVSEGIHEIGVTLFETLAIVILVVFIFLQTWRATIIPMATVPVSLLGVFVLFPLFGFSINTLSMFGLVLAIGLVVDDAIVVVEAVQHHIEQGMSPRDATLQAMREVAGPVVAVALVLSSVFIPVAFVPGIKGRLFQQFAITIAISVLISAFNALSLSPALAALLLKPASKRRGLMTRVFERFNRGFVRTTDRYTRLSSFFVRKLVVAVAVLAVFGAGATVIGKKLPTAFVPDEDQGYLFGHVELPDAASLQRTETALEDVRKILAETEGVKSYTTVAGYSLLTQMTASNTALFFVNLKPWDERKGQSQTSLGIFLQLNMKLAQLAKARAFAFPPPAIPGIGTGGGFDVMLEDRSGALSIEELGQHVERFVAAASKRPELMGVISLFRPTVPQLFARVDEAAALRQGVDLNDLYTTLSSFMGGYYVNDFYEFGRVWRVYMQADAGFRAKPESIDRFYVRNRDNKMVPLSSLVAIKRVSGPLFTTRFNMYRGAEIIGAPMMGYSSAQAMAALAEVAKQTLPKQMRLDWSGMSYQEAHAGGVAGVLVLSLVLVFLVMAAQYESWSLPFSVLLSTPVALFGALFGLLVRLMPFDVYGQIGLIMLVGLAAKNAILIVEFARAQLEEEEHGAMAPAPQPAPAAAPPPSPVERAALTALTLRFRPILMTSFAFVFGMLPLWTATGAGAVSRRELGSAVIVGMAIATVFGVLLVPAMFVLVERIVRFRRRRRVRATKALPAPPGGQPA